MSADAPAAVPTSSTTTSQSSPALAPIDLRHMTSNPTLVVENRRTSQHLQATVRKGSRSPSSIPSSPTSVHSSSSAIFERDIEPVHLSIGSKKDPHRIPRSKNTESIEQSVPSVLDSAASILASMDTEDGDSISVIGPAPLPSAGLLDQSTVRSRSSGFASPIGFRSRSPSPSPRPGGAKRTSLLLNLPGVSASPPAPGSSSPSASNVPLRPFVDAATPTSNKRLSFISYSDLLSSTPTATQPLSALTSPTSSPSHIPSVALASASDTATIPGSASAYGGTSGAPSLRNFGGFGPGDEDHAMNDIGGEWEREGLGKGLEERLEALQSVGMA